MSEKEFCVYGIPLWIRCLGEMATEIRLNLKCADINKIKEKKK